MFLLGYLLGRRRPGRRTRHWLPNAFFAAVWPTWALICAWHHYWAAAGVLAVVAVWWWLR